MKTLSRRSRTAFVINCINKLMFKGYSHDEANSLAIMYADDYEMAYNNGHYQNELITTMANRYTTYVLTKNEYIHQYN